jgi:hypothetical protein
MAKFLQAILHCSTSPRLSRHPLACPLHYIDANFHLTLFILEGNPIRFTELVYNDSLILTQ